MSAPIWAKRFSRLDDSVPLGSDAPFSWDIIEAAQMLYDQHDLMPGDIDIDHEAVISSTPSGHWVQAWVWVPNEAVGG